MALPEALRGAPRILRKQLIPFVPMTIFVVYWALVEVDGEAYRPGATPTEQGADTCDSLHTSK